MSKQARVGGESRAAQARTAPAQQPVEATMSLRLPAQFGSSAAQARSDPRQSLADSIRAASGRGSALPGDLSDRLGDQLGFDVGGVRVHTDSAADRMARSLGARAFTSGADIFFGSGQYAPRSASGGWLLSHELAHVKQQGGRAGAVQRKVEGFSRPGDAAEQRADAAADAIAAGRPVPEVGSLPAGVLSCAVDTRGGSWDTTAYTAFGPAHEFMMAGDSVGCDIRLKFTPGWHCPRDVKVGLIQTVKSLSNGASTFSGQLNQRTALTDEDTHRAAAVGVGIDRLSDPNPVYGATGAAASLTERLPNDADDAWGMAYTWKSNKPAKLFDSPRQPAINNSSQMFETAAMVLEGDKAGKFLGSVSWGYTYTVAGGVVLSPLALVSNKKPSATFYAAMDKWNDSEEQAENVDLVQIPMYNRPADR